MTTHQMAIDTQAYCRANFLAVTRETKLTLSIAVNPKSKLTLERGTNPTNRNITACLNVHYRHPQRIIVTLLWSEIMDGYNTADTMVEIGA